MKYASIIVCMLLPCAAFAAQQYATLAELSDAERKYYALSFAYTMDAVQAGTPYAWGSYSGKGEITPSAAFISKSRSVCRNFTETYTIGGAAGAGEGIGCKRNGDEGWCKLRKGQAMTCAMEKPGIMFDMDIPNVNVAAPNLRMPSGSNSNGEAIGNVGGNGSSNAPAAFNAGGNSKSPTGNDVADTVTNAAGSVAGPATGGAIKWFSNTFR